MAVKDTKNATVYICNGSDHPALFTETFFTGTPHWIDSAPPDLTDRQRGRILVIVFLIWDASFLTCKFDQIKSLIVVYFFCLKLSSLNYKNAHIWTIGWQAMDATSLIILCEESAFKSLRSLSWSTFYFIGVWFPVSKHSAFERLCCNPLHDIDEISHGHLKLWIFR